MIFPSLRRIANCSEVRLRITPPKDFLVTVAFDDSHQHQKKIAYQSKHPVHSQSFGESEKIANLSSAESSFRCVPLRNPVLPSQPCLPDKVVTPLELVVFGKQLLT